MSIPSPSHDPHARWRFLRDVVYFQLKLILGNLQNFLLLPVSIGAAILDLVMKGNSGREGERFYWVLRWGRHTDEMIDIYSAIGGYEHEGEPDRGSAMKAQYTVDSVLARIEGVIVREYEKGGTAASVKGAVDKAIDEMQAKTGTAGDRANEIIKTATDKLRDKMDKPPQP
jgi:hypothetical protein